MRKPKLKKLKNSVLLTTPFNTILPKRIRKKALPWEHYPHIPILSTNSRLRRSLLGLRLQWTIKEDGENVTIWLKKKKYVKGSSSLYTGLVTLPKGFELMISSHNQENASADITARVQGTEEYQKILKLIADNPSFRVVAEECRKGASVTGIRQYPKAILYVVDIFDTAINNFLPYTLVYQNCYHYGIPVVKLYAETRHRTIKDLIKFSNHVLEYCNTEKEYGKDEGMVLKTFSKNKRCMDCGKNWVKNGECMGCHSKHIEEVEEYIQAKVKLDIPRPIIEKVREGPPKLPQIPDSEIMGAISHVEADFGLTGQPKDDMPRIAQAVAEECRKHLYSSRPNLFVYYQNYMELAGNRK